MRRGGTSAAVIAVAGILAGMAGAWVLGSAQSPSRTMPTTHGEWVFLQGPRGDTLRAYVAYPERKDKAPAVLVIHEIFGLSEWEPTVGDRLAAEGFVAIVPDFLSPRFGVTPPTPDSGRKLTALLTPEEVNASLDVAFAYANTLPAVRAGDIGVIGFCWGGGRSFHYATANPKLKAAVVCYGPAPDSALFGGIRAKVLGVYGEDDARIDAALPDVERQLRTAGADYRYDIYPGTGHGFLRPGRKGAEGPEVERAWGRILGFFRTTLGS